MPPRRLLRSIASLVLLFSLCAAPLVFRSNEAKAAGRNVATTPIDKVSPELRQLIQSGQGSTPVKLIVQSTSTSSTSGGGLLGGIVGSLVQSVGGVVKGLLSALNITLVEAPANSVDVLAADPSVSYISLDTQVRTFGHMTTTTGAQQVRTQKALLGSYQLDGSNVSIAVLDSGIDATHKSFSSQSGKITVNKDFTGENRTDDPYGHGTHVASVAAGVGTPTSGAYEGVAPAAKLLNLRVINSQGIGTVSGVLKALDWVLANRQTYNVRVVNMSLGTPAIISYKNDPICQVVRKLVNAGVVVVAAAGNDGKTAAGQKVYGGIHCPGNEPSAITVGASNTYGSDARNEDSITTYSSHGPTRSFSTDVYGTKHYDNLIKPDLVAPGNKIIAAEAKGNKLVATHPELATNKYTTINMKLMYMSGTSVSAPVVAGAAALLLEANPNLTPNMVKMILMYTAQPLKGFNTYEQGAGQLNVAGSVAVAGIVRNELLGLTPALGSSLLTTTAPISKDNYLVFWIPVGAGFGVEPHDDNRLEPDH